MTGNICDVENCRWCYSATHRLLPQQEVVDDEEEILPGRHDHPAGYSTIPGSASPCTKSMPGLTHRPAAQDFPQDEESWPAPGIGGHLSHTLGALQGGGGDQALGN